MVTLKDLDLTITPYNAILRRAYEQRKQIGITYY